jgi:hypothetical protein
MKAFEGDWRDVTPMTPTFQEGDGGAAAVGGAPRLIAPFFSPVGAGVHVNGSGEEGESAVDAAAWNPKDDVDLVSTFW